MLGRMSLPTHLSPLPPVEQVRPGLWSVPVPIPDNPLRYVFVYAFETDDGVYIVDAGWNTDDAWHTLCDGLRTAGFDIDSVKGVMVTHIHPDHYGLAGRVREASGAWVALHPEDAALIRDRYEEPDELLGRMAEYLAWLGVPMEEIDDLAHASMQVRKFVTTIRPDILMEDGDKPEVPGWDLVALWTPGHSPGHLCFYEHRYRLMLSGDHVLPRITPNIPFHPQAGDDPLGAFLRSLERLAPYESNEVLPAHEHRFVGLRGRLAELAAHHERRFLEVTAALADGLTTPWEVAGRMKWSRPWSSITGFMRRAAAGEAMAHLRALERRGVVVCREGVPARFELKS